MRKPLLSVLRQNTKLLNSIIFFTCWSQLHAHANSVFLNKGDNVTPIMEVSSSPDRKIKNKEPEKSKDIQDSSNPKRKPEHKDKPQFDMAPSISILHANNIDKEGVYGKKRYYLSDIKEGIIGTDADHPIDQVYDNIFTISLNEKINPGYQYTLEYDLYGAASYEEVSKVVNDELAAGGNNLQKTEGWMHQSEPISVSSVHQGINTVIFTIPHLSKYSYKVRNLQIGVSEKKQNLGSIEKKYKAATVSKFVANIGGTEKMSLGSAELTIPQGALKSSETFSITALRDIDMPVLSPEMVNVTSQNAGYRFLPHGEHFSAPAKVEIGYDKSKIPTGYTEQDIRTYYFDKQQKKWIALEKDTLSHQQSALISKTTHFTDMVNGILKVPESPETGSYAPNSIKDIKAANPSEGIVSIAPPSPNSMGSVTTNFPIKLPAGRGGMQPSLNVSYSSEGGNGWMGMGWDLSIPAVSIDTRWGVPTYGVEQNGNYDTNNAKETEIYTLGGEQLTFKVGNSYVLPNRAEGFEQKRVDNLEPDNTKRFYPRIEGGYSKIIRKGNNPNNYVWIVTSKDGTRSCFGGDENGNVIENAVLRDTPIPDNSGNIGYWALYKTIDSNGNYVKYEYNKSAYSSSGVLGNGGKEMYPSKIEYTLNDANPSLKKYTVNFGYDAQQREDVHVNARLGFVQVTSRRLGNVQILYDGAKVRSYDFQYKTGAFSKSLLESITEKDADDNIFYTNKVEYHEMPAEVFSSPKEWNVNITGVSPEANSFSGNNSNFSSGSNDTFTGEYTAINSSKSESKNNSFGLGFWIYKSPSPTVADFFALKLPEMKRFSLGVNGGFGNGKSSTRISMIDIDGDNLLDIIYRIGDTAFFGKNKGGYFQMEPINMLKDANNQPINSIGNSETSYWNAGLSGNLSFGVGIKTGVGFDYSNTTSKNSVYFNDFNADGLMDLAFNGKVLFNYIEGGVPKFSESSSITPAPINILQANSVNDFSFNASEKKMMLEQNPLHDVVKVWVAPKAGNIVITGNTGLIQQTIPSDEDVTNLDGVVLSTQRGGNTPTIVRSINHGDYTVQNMSSLVYSNVLKGEKFYFRVTSKYDGRYDQVNWDPIITYTSNTTPSIDGNNRSLNQYKLSEDFIVSNTENYSVSENGTLKLNIVKPPISDHVRITVYKNGLSVWNLLYTPTDNVSTSVSVPVTFLAGDQLKVLLETNTNIHWPDVNISPIFTTASGTQEYIAVENSMFNFNESVVASAFTYLVTSNDSGKKIVLKPSNTSSSVSGNFIISAKIKNRLVGLFGYSVNNGVISAGGNQIGGAQNTLTSQDINENLYIEITTSEKRSTNAAFLDYLKNLNIQLTINEVPASANTNTIVGGTVTLISGQIMSLNLINSGPPSGSGYPSALFKYRLTGSSTWITQTLQASSSSSVLSTPLNLSPGTYQYEVTINYNGQATYYGTNAFISVLKITNKTFVNSPLVFTDLQQPLSTTAIDARLGLLYRGWGSFIVNGNNNSRTNIVNAYSINDNYYNQGTAAEMKVEVSRLFISNQAMTIDTQPVVYPNVNNDVVDPYQPGSASPSNLYFVMMAPGVDKSTNMKKWYGMDEENYVTGSIMNSSRLGVDNIEASFSNNIPNVQLGSDKLSSLVQKTKTNSVSVKGDVSYSSSGLGGDGSFSKTIFVENKLLSTIADYNGDGFPDFVIEDNVQLTNSNGFLSKNKKLFGHNSIGRSSAIGVGAGSGYTHGSSSFHMNVNVAAKDGVRAIDLVNSDKEKSLSNNVSLSGNYSKEDEYTKKSFVDINGDGVLDRVDNTNVALGKGYSFDSQVYDLGFEVAKSNNQNYGAGLGVSLFGGSISAGGSFGGSTNISEQQLVDLNGDGLQDFIDYKNDQYKLNLGNRFENFSGFNVGYLDEKTVTVNSSSNFGLSIPILIPLPIILPAGTVSNGFKIIPSFGRTTSKGVSRTKSTYKDINGDGFPDIIQSNDINKITVRLNQLGEKYDANGNATVVEPTNLLKKVTTPMGGSWEVSYERVGNTYDMPQSKYVMKTVTTNDGFTGDNAFSPDVSKVTIKYENPYHSRRERTFYGFEKVTVNQIDTKQGGISSNVIYRKTEQTFNNKNYYLKGALLNEKLSDASGKLWTEKNNTYEFRKIDSPNTLNTLLNQERESEKNHHDYACFVALKNTVSKFYEGTTTATKFTSMSITEYSNWGDAVKVINNGDTQIGITEAISSEVTYGEVAPGKYVIAPKSVKNTATGVTREKRAEYNPATGDLTKIVIKNQGIDYSVYDFEYDVYGNITKSTGPENYAGQRFYHQYTYDDKVKTYPVKVQEAFGYSSKTQYDFRFGLPILTEDMNLQPMKYVYDAKARTTEIVGPYEMFNNIPWTIKFEYNPITNAPQNASNAQSYAITKHYDPEYTDSTINTITIADGLGAAIQVKKTGDIHNEGAKYIVAGKVEQDAFGRALKTYYPTTESVSSGNTQYNASVDNIEPTINQYDILDRVVYTKLPGENLFSTIAYGFGTDVQGRNMFETIFKDELGSIKKTYTDIKGRTTSVHEVSNTGDIKTQFTHDAIGEILQVKDVNNNITTSVYDNLGRRISYTHPDSGVTTYKYDPANNMTSKTNAANETVEYKYDYSRLKEVKYPLYPENNVKYYYGNALDASAMDNNAVGRLWYQTDATGTQYLKYGRLGELTYQRRSVAVPGAGVYWFGTQWEYDTWNRVKSIIYPDGEVLNYKYNRAGNLNNVSSDKDGNHYKIINGIGYDKFEQRVYLANGNGTETTYEYETNRRRLLKMYAKNSSRYFMQNTYQYDVVSNVMQVHNNAPIVNGLLGGGTNHAFGYDDLYRLTSASGNWRGINTQAQEERHRYTVTMTYDNMHNIMSKTQKHEWTTGATNNNWAALEPTSYRLNYKYENAAHPHAPSRIIDEPNIVPNATCCNPDDPGVKFQNYQYDAKGNPTAVSQETCTFAEAKTVYQWDEENRLRFVDTNPSTPEVDGAAIYTYDAGGERIIKDVLSSGVLFRTGGEQTSTWPQPLYTSHSATIYPNGLVTVNFIFDNSQLGTTAPRYTKHYYAGSQRIVSKIGTSPNIGMFDCHWLIIPLGGTTPPINPVNVSNTILQTATQSSLNVMQLNSITPPPNYGQNAGYNGNCVNNYTGPKEEQIYWFHTDHLGSSSYITGADGEVTQNIEYFPSGEVFVENHNKASNNSPYKFNAKELDAETGYYYYGARYYNPRVSLWLNVDPLAEKYPSWSPYAYCGNNPINYFDPDGRFRLPANATREERRLYKEAIKTIKSVFRDSEFREAFKDRFKVDDKMIRKMLKDGDGPTVIMNESLLDLASFDPDNPNVIKIDSGVVNTVSKHKGDRKYIDNLAEIIIHEGGHWADYKMDGKSQEKDGIFRMSFQSKSGRPDAGDNWEIIYFGTDTQFSASDRDIITEKFDKIRSNNFRKDFWQQREIRDLKSQKKSSIFDIYKKPKDNLRTGNR